MPRPLDVGAVVRKVFDIYVEEAPVLMPTAAVVFVFTEIIATLLLVTHPALAILAALIDLVATTLFAGMVVKLVADVQDGRRDATPLQLVRAVTPVLGQLILVGLVAAIGVLFGLIALIIPGLILLTIWSLAAPVVVIEHPGVLAALGRSRDLVRGNGLRVFGVILLLFVLVRAVGVVLEAAAESAGSGAGLVVRVVVGVLIAPLPALAASVLYFDLVGPRRARAVVDERPNSFGN